MTVLSIAPEGLSLFGLSIVAVLYLAACARHGAPSIGRQAGFAAGWLAAIGALALPGGLAPMLLLSGVAAPLMIAGLSPRMLARLPGGSATAAAAVFTAALWYWHVPGPEALADAGGAGQAVMQLTLLGAALALWRGLALRPDRLTAVLLTGVQLAALGAWQGQVVMIAIGGLLLAGAAALAAMPFAPARAGLR